MTRKSEPEGFVGTGEESYDEWPLPAPIVSEKSVAWRLAAARTHYVELTDDDFKLYKVFTYSEPTRAERFATDGDMTLESAEDLSSALQSGLFSEIIVYVPKTEYITRLDPFIVGFIVTASGARTFQINSVSSGRWGPRDLRNQVETMKWRAHQESRKRWWRRNWWIFFGGFVLILLVVLGVVFWIHLFLTVGMLFVLVVTVVVLVMLEK